ncbi:hypothetical protein VMCG_06333 [Cytospora schulzeri]|uniref:Aminoglycoside phosphotransferase domain-containing protein n=1 Tax=Cytospora schulzeri TaxID=448051 RepID=A0A423W854_9PEZI|nr:hypothetical protein VMCG_06333 [Valsa malicola]
MVISPDMEMAWERYLPTDRLRWTRCRNSCPIWPSDPDLTIIKKLAASLLTETPGLPDLSSLQVKFLADGARHKVYELSHPSAYIPYLFRVAIPLDPYYKMESEMATLAAIRRYTSIPVPRPISWSSSADNELGYEWCLVERVPGVELREVWRKMPWDKKLEVVDQMAEFMVQLWGPALRFSKIGSVYFDRPGGNKLGEHSRETEGHFTTIAAASQWGFNIGPSVDQAFFSDRRRYLDQDRGPYKTFHDYAKALVHVEMEYFKTARTLVMSKPEITNAYPDDDWDSIAMYDIGLDEDDLEEYDDIMAMFQAYIDLLPTVFPEKEEEGPDMARFSLHHCDLRYTNVIVDPETYKVTGIIDWEQSITVPEWYTRDYPDFLQGDDPYDGDGHRTPDTYDSDDERYNAVVVDNRDRWDERLLRARFDKKMEELGWKDWKRYSYEDKAKSSFLQGLSDMADVGRAKFHLEQARQLLASTTQAKENSGREESGHDVDDDVQGGCSPKVASEDKPSGSGSDSAIAADDQDLDNGKDDGGRSEVLEKAIAKADGSGSF